MLRSMITCDLDKRIGTRGYMSKIYIPTTGVESWQALLADPGKHWEYGTCPQSGLNSYKLSVKEWVGKTNAIGLRSEGGGNIKIDVERVWNSV